MLSYALHWPIYNEQGSNLPWMARAVSSWPWLEISSSPSAELIHEDRPKAIRCWLLPIAAGCLSATVNVTTKTNNKKPSPDILRQLKQEKYKVNNLLQCCSNNWNERMLKREKKNIQSLVLPVYLKKKKSIRFWLFRLLGTTGTWFVFQLKSL